MPDLAREEAPRPDEPPERRLAAILCADLVGYSRMMEADEATTLAAVKGVRREVIDPLIAEHHGRLVKVMGDGAIVAFVSVVDAVRCAIAVQKRVAAQQADVAPERRLRFRIGINLGDLAVDGDDLYGDGVNIAARLEQLCEPGGVLVSGTAYDHLQGKLDLPLEFIGEQHVKNIARPVRAYRVRLDGRRARWRMGTRRFTPLLPALAAALLAFALGGGAWWWLAPEAATAKPAIAVLPFNNYGGDEATGRLADGLTEDIITDLARFRDLDVIARNSADAYKGKPVDVRQVGKALNVDYVLEGSIQRQGERIRITTQLIDATTGAHVWSDRWDRPAEDVFAVQTEMAERVANKLGSDGVLADAGSAAAKRKRPESLTAYDLYLLGNAAIFRNTKESIEEGIRLLTRAVELDPNLARAWVSLSLARGWTEHFGGDPEVARKGREEAARRALELDPMDADAHSVMAAAYAWRGEFALAEAEMDKALSLNPSSLGVLRGYISWASSFGEAEKGAEAVDRAIRLDPNYLPAAAGPYTNAYFFAGRYEDMLRMMDRIPLESRRKFQWVQRAAAYAALRRSGEAQAAVSEALTKYPDISIEGFVVADPSYSEGERAHMVETMRAAGFPVCASAAKLAEFDTPDRLPECDAERAKMAGAS
jgi:TolB-like protein/class 3 adenylate cyclase